jgi:hypothetical protein
VPESDLSSRNIRGGSALAQTSQEGVAAALRLAVLSSLPAKHQTYLFDRVHEMCHMWLRRNRISAGDMAPRELASEVWLKLVASVSLDDNDAPELPELNPDEWSVDLSNPERDGRVTWLITEIGGFIAIKHRYQDLERERYGRSFRLQQPNEEEPEEGEGDTDDCTEGQRREDVLHVWRGLLATAQETFGPEEDVSLLLKLLADMPDVLDESFGTQWPIGTLVALLKERPPPRAWSGHKVDNAKRRLMNWIGRLMSKNGLDAVDLEALFASVARKRAGGTLNRPQPWLLPRGLN